MVRRGYRILREPEHVEFLCPREQQSQENAHACPHRAWRIFCLDLNSKIPRRKHHTREGKASSALRRTPELDQFLRLSELRVGADEIPVEPCAKDHTASRFDSSRDDDAFSCGGIEWPHDTNRPYMTRRRGARVRRNKRAYTSSPLKPPPAELHSREIH